MSTAAPPPLSSPLPPAAPASPLPAAPGHPAAGIALCVFGLFLFSVQDLIIKWFSGAYSVLQLVFIRGLAALPLILIAVRLTGGWRGLRCARPKLLLARGLLGFLSYLAYYMALAALPLVEVVTLVFAAPVILTVLSAAVLKEPVGARRWSALAVGFAAIVLVVGPSGDFRHLATFLALFAAFAYACQNLLTRVIGVSESPWTVILYTLFAFIGGSVAAAAAVAVFGGALLDGVGVGAGAGVGVGAGAGGADNPALQFLLRPWKLPPLGHGLLMLFLGLNTALAFYCITRAYRETPVSVVAPFEYTYIIWAVLFGYLLWGETPKTTSIIGVALLVGSGLYIFRRELRLSAQAADGQPRPRRWRKFRGGGLPTVDSGGVRPVRPAGAT
ncbi:MAG: DMT family transporter [Gammaproteobacteria bacterium]|nr:DMT family transporter [Gammaproteobacteria bacterium]